MPLASKNVLLRIERGATFTKKFRWKDKYREPINLTGFEFKSQFRREFGEENVLCTLTMDNGITVVPAEGIIEITIGSDVTSTLVNYDSGMWSLEYRNDVTKPFKTLIRGRWVVEPEVTV